jgi:hypothetical protein
MNGIGKKIGIAIVGLSLAAAAGGATVALAGDGSGATQRPSVASQSASPNDDGTPDQGHGDVPAEAGDDHGQHRGEHRHERGDDHGRHRGEDDHGGHHGDDSGHHGDEDDN